jgi:5-aminolevulinate synthase
VFFRSFPRAFAPAALASIRHLKESQVERFAHQERVRRLRSLLDQRGIPHMVNPSHIVPVIVGDAAKCKWISDLLLDNFGIYVQPINYPTVPKKTERLRITPTPMHSDADIDHLVGALHSLWSRCALARAVA